MNHARAVDDAPRRAGPPTGCPTSRATIIVTGANSGIGLEAARVFAAKGAHVMFAVRDVTKGQDAAASVTGSTEVRLLDLADLASVRAFAARWSGDIHPAGQQRGAAGADP